MKTVLLFFSLCLTVMAETTGSVEFKIEEVTLTCPEEFTAWDDKSDWSFPTHTLKYTADVKGLHKCKKTETEKYYFYIKGYVCPNCYELDGTLVIGFVIGDLLVTMGIVILIYHCAQKKSGSSPASAVARPGPRGGQRGPAVPNRDYEVLNPRTRDATYAVAGVNRTG
ncbi:T-cell surface glycoprotein CD3 epsilon chain-like [Brienomyrus brachyistius]|uniref:T-cell surface glycoprotein CD3 epsilon chain-like n=1 Tax=Brienomyrus brachyistius TaxID=42636 RepID=UPI0020B2515D|nr:T-cell surface glycoprotein CD3 epsilon chain-like [Brienomyrus brachyistius]XP_048837048.1 T-cell surface glycoprotein CD3 epsilon chain-like [Brienomyrus brachyistius]XP_048837049.1 T-cell surface glycoprotein CD3 epsilon chain-like [Brienomyrus brachyistius]